MEKIMVLPDLQVPYHDVAFVKKLLRVVKVFKPAKIVQIGDLIDLPEVSRWTKGGAGEYASTLQDSLDTCRQLLTELRELAPNAEIIVKEGNHDERFEKYVKQYAPALSSLRSSSLSEQLRLPSRGIAYERRPFELSPGVLAVHGHERSYSMVPGKYELDRIRQHGMSIVSGHTHTPVMVTTATAVGFQQQHYFGMNVGHAMDVSKIGYVKDGYVNWCQGFGLIEVGGGVSYPRLITAPQGRFVFQGKEY